MTCPSCRHANPPESNFCLGCGGRLALACASCGIPLPAGSRFCNKRGTPVTAKVDAPARFTSPESYTPRHLAEKILTSKAALEGERKQVTVLFADLKGSMELLADRDPEEARKILDPVLELMMEAVHRYEGTVNQVMGDGIMALFGAPLAHEDHAVRACYAALRMQESVKKYAEAVRHSHAAVVKIRVGLNSGDVVVRAIGSDLHMDYTAVGQTTHLAAWMEQLADPGAIVITPETLALAEGYVEVKSLGPVPVKGLGEPVEVYEVTGAGQAQTRLQAAVRRGLMRFVGRDAELEQLRRAQDLARNGHGQVAAIVGEAGVGKSRLIYEHFGNAAPASVYDRVQLVMSLAELGRFAEAAENAAEAIRLSELTHHAYTVSQAHRAASMLHVYKGDWAKARVLIEHWIAVLRARNVVLQLPMAVASSAWVLAQLGEASEALSRLREGEHLLERAAARGFHGYRSWALLGRACLLLDRLDEAQRLGERAVESSRSHPGFTAHELHLLGDIATHPDRFDAEIGEAHYRKALALAGPRRMRPLVAHCHLSRPRDPQHKEVWL